MKPLTAYGTLDVMSCRLQDNNGVQRDLNLNGIRETVLGVRTSDAPGESTDWRLVGNFEAAFSADRGEQGRVYTIDARQTFVGVAGPWGQSTVGRQYNVLTNIAWSALNPINNGWGIYFNDLLYLGDSFTRRNNNLRDLGDAGANWFLGYTQDGAQYQFKGAGYSVQAEFVPGGSPGGLFGRDATTTIGDMSMAFARYRQNGASLFGSGSARGKSAVAEYALTAHLNVYMKADYLRHIGGSHGAKVVFATPDSARNFMLGL